MICARKAPSCGLLCLKERLKSHLLVKSLWMLSYNLKGNQFLQSHIPAVLCGRSLFHSKSSDSDISIHSYKKARNSADKVIDDELDYNIDLENELKWLNDRVRNGTGQSAKDYSRTPMADPQETNSRGWLNDLSLVNSHPSLDVLPKHSRPIKSRVFPVYREPCARVSSTCRPPPLTTDVAVEIVTGELKAVFGLNRYYAHRIASWLRRPFYNGTYKNRIKQPQLPPALDTGPAATEALVARARDTIRTLHQLGTPPWLLYQLPMLVKMSSSELLSKAPLLVGPGLFSQVSEGLSLLLMPLPSLRRSLNGLLAESRYLTHHRNRLYFIADALNVCVGSVCCGAAVAGATRLLRMDLIKLARAMDTFNYYRLERRYILTHMDVFLLKLSVVRQRYDLMVRASNPPNVVAALHAASLLPAHARAWPLYSFSFVLEDGDTESTAGLSGNTDGTGGRGNGTGQNDESAAARAADLRVGKRGTGGYSLRNGGGDENSSSLKVSAGGLGLKVSEAGGDEAAAAEDPMAKHDLFMKGEEDSGSHTTAHLETISDNKTTPAIDYQEKSIYDNSAMINDLAIKSKPMSRNLSATDNTRPASACPTATVYSLSAAELEEILKDYVPPSANLGRMSEVGFKTLLKRKLEMYGKSLEGSGGHRNS